jgi:hypothetical protein
VSTQPVIHTYSEYTGYRRLQSTKIDWDRTFSDKPDCKYWHDQGMTLCEIMDGRLGVAAYDAFTAALPEPANWMQYTLWLRAALDLSVRERGLTPTELATKAVQTVCQHAHVETDETGSIRMMAGDVNDDRRAVRTCTDCGKVMDEPKAVDDELEF